MLNLYKLPVLSSESTCTKGDSQISLVIPLYRDDALITITNHSSRMIDKTQKDIQHFLKDLGFNIIFDSNTNSSIVNFLDITLNISNGQYFPYRKTNDTIKYINKHSNHPRSILDNLAGNISIRLSSLSANREVFNNISPPYNEVLARSGFTEKIHYLPSSRNNRSKKCRSKTLR